MHEELKERIKILVVDDEDSVRKLLMEILASEGWKVSGAKNGTEAFAHFQGEPAQIVFTDLVMPEMNGFELTQKLMELKPGIPVIAITGYADKEVILKAIKAGISDVFEKPFTVPQIALALSRAISKIELESLLAKNIEKLQKTQEALTLAKGELADQVAEKTSELIHAKGHLEQVIADIRAANERLVEFDRRKTEFLVNASHQLKTPLAIIKSYLYNLQVGLKGELSQAQREVVDKIGSNIERLNYTIKELLNLSQIESGKLRAEAVPLSLEGPIQRIIDMLSPKAQSKNITVKTKFGSNLPPAYCDRGKLEEILLNVIDNAIEYTQAEGEVMIAIQKKDSRTLCISVQDNGPGIPEEEVPSLFDRYRRLGKPKKEGEPGLGLGLAIAQDFAKIQGGLIRVESAVGKGTMVCIDLPEAEAALQKKAA